MKQVIFSWNGNVPARWSRAFPEHHVVTAKSALLEAVDADAVTVWLAIGGADKSEVHQLVSTLAEGLAPVVVLSPMPDEEAAFAYLSAGVKGYCRSEAAVEQLIEVSHTVTAGGMWMPPKLAQRFLTLAQRLSAATSSADGNASALSVLTDRELDVAQLVGRGFSNREIAEHLSLTERTVKAHLTHVFEKLFVRDRVQLALLMNGILPPPGSQ